MNAVEMAIIPLSLKVVKGGRLIVLDKTHNTCLEKYSMNNKNRSGIEENMTDWLCEFRYGEPVGRLWEPTLTDKAAVPICDVITATMYKHGLGIGLIWFFPRFLFRSSEKN